MSDELHGMLVDQLKDAHSAERQAIQAMKRTLRKASEPQLREGLEAHIAQSEEQRERVEQALEKLGAKAGRKVCEAMRGLVEEAQHEMEEHEKGPVLDLVIVAGQQRMEHYEIAAYGTMAELAKALGEDEVAELLGTTLAEEKAQDERLTEVTRGAILPAALGEGEEDEEDEGEEGEEEEEEGEGGEEEEEGKSAKGRGGRGAAAAGKKGVSQETVGSGKGRDPNNFANDPARAAAAGRKGGRSSHKND
jgi:ferritin-like metal-binding protein YciE